LECFNAWVLEHTQDAMKDGGSFDLVFDFLRKRNDKDHEIGFVSSM